MDGVIDHIIDNSVVEGEKDINSITSDIRHELKEWTFSNKSLTRVDSTGGISL